MNDDEPLPLPIARLRALANTVDVEEGTDALAEPDDLRAWLVAQDLHADGIDAHVHALARALRDALREVLAGHHEGAVRPEGVAAFAEVSAALPLRAAVGSDGLARLVPALDGARGALASFLADVVTATAEGTFARLKLCPQSDCAWAFYDRSRNRSRRWCSMDVCGSRVKARAYRARHSTQA